MSKKNRFHRESLENQDEQNDQVALDIRNTIDYVNLPANQRNRSFGKRRDKMNKPQRGGIRD